LKIIIVSFAIMSSVFVHCHKGSSGNILQKLHGEKSERKKKTIMWLVWI